MQGSVAMNMQTWQRKGQQRKRTKELTRPTLPRPASPTSLGRQQSDEARRLGTGSAVESDSKEGIDPPPMEGCERDWRRSERSWQAGTFNSLLVMLRPESTLPESDKQSHHIAGGVERVKSKPDTTFLLIAEVGNQRSPGCGREFG